MACCDKKKPIFVGTLILVAITIITSSTKDTTPQPPQESAKADLSANHTYGIGTLEQSEEKQKLWVKAMIHEPQKKTFKIGQSATVTFRATGKKPYAGIVRKISALNQYLPQKKVLCITVDDLPKTAAIGEQAEISICIP